MFKFVLLSEYRTSLKAAIAEAPQDASGWTPLMIASSLRDGDDVVDLLLSKNADATMKSASLFPSNPLMK